MVARRGEPARTAASPGAVTGGASRASAPGSPSLARAQAVRQPTARTIATAASGTTRPMTITVTNSAPSSP